MLVVLGIIFLPVDTITAQVSLIDVQGIWIGANGGQNVNGVGTNHINWGMSNGQQSGYLFAPVPSVFPVDVNLGVNFDIAKFTHNNFVVKKNSSVAGATLATNLTFLVDGETVNVSTVYDFLHNETTNVGSACCDDIVSAVNNTPFTETFVVGDFEYTFDIKGFKVNGQQFSQFLTKENQVNESILVAEITRVQVPEPSTYLLLGAMVALFVFVRSRKKSASIN